MKLIEQLFIAIFQILESTLRFIFEFIEELVTGLGQPNKEYKAEFASAGTLLSSWNLGFNLTGKSNLTRKQSYESALIIGSSGTGKSSIVLIPTLMSMHASFIVNDPSGELYSKSAGYLSQHGVQAKVLNFTRHEFSSRYNPLIRANSSSEIQKVASMLIHTSLGGKSSDPFWNTQSISLLTILITIIKKQAPEFQNLYNVRQLLNRLGSNPKAIDALFSRDADNVLFDEYNSFISYDEKVVNGIIATAKAALQIFSDDEVAKVTSRDDLNFQDFRDEPTVLFIQNSVSDQRYYSPITSLFFEQFFSFLLGRFPKEGEQDIFLLIDEASSLFLPTLPIAVANVRKYRAGCMILIQDYNQLIHQYGKYNADAIKANSFAKLYFSRQSLETAKELVETLGKYQFEDEKGQKVIRPLMTNDEIRMMKSNRALLISGNNPPVLARLRPYYKNLRYRRYSQIPAPEIWTEDALHEVPILSLPVSSSDNDA